MKNKMYMLVALLAVSAPSFAAIDPAAIVTEIGLYPAIVGAVGVAAIGVALAVRGIGWAKSSFSR